MSQDRDPLSSKEDNALIPEGEREKVHTAKKPPPDLSRKAPPKGGTLSKRFLGVPPLNVNMNATMSAMDVRKWSWPGYLTFGGSKDEQTSEIGFIAGDASTGSGSILSGPEKYTAAPSADSSTPSVSLHSRATSVSDVPVDSQALLDAFSNMRSGSFNIQNTPVAPDSAPIDEPNQESMVDVGETARFTIEAHDTPQHNAQIKDGNPREESTTSARPDNETLGDDLELAEDRANEQPTVEGTVPSEIHDDLAGANVSESVAMPATMLPSFNVTHTYLQFGDSLEPERTRILYLSVCFLKHYF